MKAIPAALALLASASCADAQGLYMLNGRATPSVIIGADGRVWPWCRARRCRPFAPDPCAAAPSAALWAANRWLRAARLRPASGRRHDRRCSRPQKAVGGDGHHEMSDLGAVCERVHRVCREG